MQARGTSAAGDPSNSWLRKSCSPIAAPPQLDSRAKNKKTDSSRIQPYNWGHWELTVWITVHVEAPSVDLCEGLLNRIRQHMEHPWLTHALGRKTMLFASGS